MAKSKDADHNMIQREDFDWGVRLTARPLAGKDAQEMTICVDIGAHKPGRGSDVRFTFPGATLHKPLRVVDAQAWGEAMLALVSQTRAVQAEMRTASEKKKR
jgi:hypothetical protein